jgi:FtsP/CotA-like multicopper oxidase with cupredoxin domain
LTADLEVVHIGGLLGQDDSRRQKQEQAGERAEMQLVHGASSALGSGGRKLPRRPCCLNQNQHWSITTTAQAGVHWIRVATLDGKEALAVLRYAGATGEPSASPVEWGERTLQPEQMRSRGPVQLLDQAREIDVKLGGSMMPYRWDINGERYPKAEPFVLRQDEWVRMTFRNPTGMDHPFHLHGHYFYVLGRPEALNRRDPVQKDTVNVPAYGELVILWQAKNPGRWFFHCHIEWHLEAGMARVIQIE